MKDINIHPIQALLDSFVNKNMAVGASALVYQDGAEAFWGCAGQLSKDRPAPFERSALMRMFSMTKVVTAAAIMKLWDMNKLSPQCPVSDFIPEYKHLHVMHADGTAKRAKTPLTIHHLLTMTAGIPYPDSGGRDNVSKAYLAQMGDGSSPTTTLDMARRIAACPLCFEPGERWMYGLCADVLGGVVVAATGMELGQFMEEEIFRPLGMFSTGFQIAKPDTPHLATLYQVDEQNRFTPRHQMSGFAAMDDSQIEMGGSGLYATVDDFMKFGEMLRLEGNGLLRPETVRTMTQNHLTSAQLDRDFGEYGSGYGYGYMVRTLMDESKNPKYHEHQGAFGWNGMGGTTLRVDPVKKRTTVLGIQRVPAEHHLFIPPLMQMVDNCL